MIEIEDCKNFFYNYSQVMIVALIGIEVEHPEGLLRIVFCHLPVDKQILERSDLSLINKAFITI